METSPVLESYWRFATERQSIFFKRIKGISPPWTEDSVLNKYKFTNAYRASDRVSQYLIREVIYNPQLSSEITEVFFRIILFKLFNKIETWESISKKYHVDYYRFNFEICSDLLFQLQTSGQKIYSNAYIMPSDSRYKKKHEGNLALLKQMMDDELPSILHQTDSMKKGFNLFKSYKTIGNFLAYQLITDVNYSEITDFNENEFTIPGPGAINGIKKCFPNTKMSYSDIIKNMQKTQVGEFKKRSLNFQSLWGRELKLIDCQNLFCEIDKYSRVAHPEIDSRGKKKIKQLFSPSNNPISYWYPPKWGINVV